MKRESALAGCIEPVASHSRLTRLNEKLRKPLAVAAAVGALAVPAARISEAGASDLKAVSKPEFIVGAIEDSVLSKNLEQAREVAETVKNMGFNTLKVTMPWTHPRQCAEIDNDLARFQNAAIATKENGLFFAINLIPGGGGGLGKAPVKPSEQECYKDTLIAYLHAFEEVHPGGDLMIELPNEPNSSTFWRQQKNREGEWIAPKSVSKLLARAYQPLKTEARNLGIKVTVIGGGLASKDRPQQFIQEMGKAKASQLMDGFSHHPYPLKNNEPLEAVHQEGGGIGFGDIGRLTEEVDKSLAKGLPVLLSEFGIKTLVPENELSRYTVNPNNQADLINEKEQAEAYAKAIRLARCNSRIGAIILFNVIDDKDGYWTSGLTYPDHSPKSSYEPVRQTLVQAKDNRYINC